jgi:DNA repair protein RecO (recombination protein O)
MLFKTHGIVFRLTKYGETSVIVNIFTGQFGLQSYIVNGVRSRNSRGKIALYQPLTLLDLVVYHKENAGILRIKEARLLHPYRNISTNVHKTTIALFIDEILNKTVKEQSQTENLCEFIIDALIQLDASERPENFHLIFLIHLSRHLGFQPGNVIEVLGDRLLDHSDEVAMQQLMRAGFSTPITLTNQQRRNLLDALIHFYARHIESFGQVRSVAVLREILN